MFTAGLIGNQTCDQISGMFKMIDENDNGTIRLEDMKRLVKDIGESVTMDELKEIISNATGGEVEISPDAFAEIFKRPSAH